MIWLDSDYHPSGSNCVIGKLKRFRLSDPGRPCSVTEFVNIYIVYTKRYGSVLRNKCCKLQLTMILKSHKELNPINPCVQLIMWLMVTSLFTPRQT
jgi:hypothetical protein